MRWRDRYLFCMEAVNQAQAATGEVKGHYLNVTAATMEDMYERAEFARELGSVDRHGRPDGRLHGDPVDGRSGPGATACILHLHRAGHGTYTRQKNHGVSFRVISKWMRLAGVDHIHAGTVVGKLEGDPNVGRTASTTRCGTTRVHRGPGRRACTSTRTGPRCRRSCRSPPAASTPGRCTSCCTTSARTSILQFGGGTIGHPMGIAAGAEANRVARRGDDQGAQRGPRLPGRGPGDPAQGRAAQPRARHRARRPGATSPSTTSRPTPRTSSRRRPPA